MSDSGRTIVFLAKTITDTVGSSLWMGIHSRAAERGITVRTYTGAALGDGAAAQVFECCGSQDIDGVLSWASSLEKPALEYFTRFKQIPVYTFSNRFTGIDCLQMDNRPGVVEAVEHLIQVHGCRRIAFIQGPETMEYFTQRREAWQETLRRHGIYDPALLSPVQMGRKDWGGIAMTQFLDERGLIPGQSLDAVITYNDLISLEAMDVLLARGIRVPEDVAMIGFNNSILSGSRVPTLATIGLPFEEQGRQAVDILASRWEGKDERPYPLVSYLVTGQTCGCQSKLVAEAAPEKRTVTEKVGGLAGVLAGFTATAPADCPVPEILPRFRSIRAQVSAELSGTVSSALAESFLDGMALALERESALPFERALTSLLALEFQNEGHFEAWHQLLSSSRTSLMRLVEEETPRYFIGGLLQQGRLMVAEAAERYLIKGKIDEAARSEKIRKAGNRIISNFELSAFSELLPKVLDEFDLTGCAIFRLDEQGLARNFLTCLSGTVLTVPEESWSAALLLPPSLGSRMGDSNLLVAPLMFGKKLLGVGVFAFRSAEPELFQSLTEQLSTFLHGALLMNDQAEMRDRLSSTLQTLENRTESVSGATNDVNTSIQGISSAMEKVAHNICDLERTLINVSGVVQSAVASGETVKLGMIEMTEHTQRIGSVVDIINELAEQTNILALNASIQAAHAGERGLAFSVVAREIKQLAYKTVESTKVITETIGNARGSTLRANEGISTLQTILRDIAQMSGDAENSIQQQSSSSNNISALLAEAARGSFGIAETLAELSRLAKTNN